MRLLLVTLSAVLVGLVILATMRSNEPILQERRLTDWLGDWLKQPDGYRGNPPPALAEMDKKHVAFLVQQLDWKPSRLVWRLNYLPSRLIGAEPFHDRPDYRVISADTLGHLGSRATAAIPALEELSRKHNQWETERRTTVRGAAIGALIRLRSESLEACVTKLLDYSDPRANDYWSAISFLGTNAAPAAPQLVKALQISTDATVKCRAASALGDIHSHPELSVLALAAVLAHADRRVRWHAVHSLEAFGHSAQPAWPALVDCLDDPDDLVRQWTTNLLQQIDAEAARKLGID